MIRIAHLTYAYRDDLPPVLNDISLDIADGENVAIIGGNGSGKTTLGYVLAGIIPPQSGTIEITPSAAMGESSQSVGFLFQDPDNGLVATTVDREVAFTMENECRDSAAMQEIVERTLRQFGIEKYREQLVWSLSGGEKQRLALAALLAVEKGIIFLDEPASFLDKTGRAILDRALEVIRHQLPAAIICRVTQFAKIAGGYDRVIALSDGKIGYDGASKDLFTDTRLMQQLGVGIPDYRAGYNPNRAAPGDKILECRQVSFGYSGSPKILTDVSCTIHRGEVLAVVGASGSGKSTLAQVMCGLQKPDSGEIIKSNTRERAVMSFQQPERQFYLESCREEIGVSLAAVNGDRRQEQIMRVMEKVELPHDEFAHRDPHTLSGGEARRLAFAITIAIPAAIYIFDEPTCALDPDGISAFIRMIHTLRTDGRGVVIITHDSDIVASLADRVMLLGENGNEIFASPRDFYSTMQAKVLLEPPTVIPV